MRESIRRTLLAVGLVMVTAAAVIIAMNASPVGGWTLPEDDAAVWVSLLGRSVHLPLLVNGLCLGWGVVWLVWELTRREVRLHRVALVLLLSMGLMFALCKPGLNITGYDEEQHRIYASAFSGRDGYAPADYMAMFNTWFFGYLPYLAGMRLGLALGLCDGWVYRLGMAAGAAAYAVLGMLAVKYAPRLKLTFLTVAALPSCVMIASNVSYDGVVIGCCLLGTALVLDELSRPGRLLSPGRAVAMTSVLAMGTLPKPAYSLALLLLLLLPRSKFASRRRCAAFRAFAVLVLVLCLCSMLLGMYDSIIPGDDRMSDTDSAGQLALIRQHPGRFLMMLGRYLVTELPLLFAYAGMTWSVLLENHVIAVALLAALALLCPLCTLGESGPSPLTGKRRAVMAAVGLLPLLGLIVTQYMVSTAVGADTVVGMQPRYVLPVLATLLAAIAPPDTLRRRCRPAGRGLAAVMAAALMAVTFICAWQEVFQTMYGL